jgi:uncharacterized lipoprotein NlpE involved in copper resistance
MRNLSKKVLPLVLAVPFVVLAGCATQADLDALRDEVMKIQEMAQSAEQSAAASAAEARRAADEAKRAADEAKAASEKADRIYQESLRK